MADSINNRVDFVTLDGSYHMSIPAPSLENVTEFIQGKTVTTPTGNKITQVMFRGVQISSQWDGLDVDDFSKLKTFIEDHGYEGFNYGPVDGGIYNIKVVVDGLTGFTHSVRYNRLAGKRRYTVSLKMIQIP